MIDTLKKLSKVNWPLLGVYLSKHYTYKEIQKTTGIDWRSHGRLTRGETKAPRYTAGINLLMLAHKKLSDDELRRVGL